MKKLTTEEFIIRAKKIFPNYNYSEVNYIGANKYINIICPIHGKFKKYPSEIINKHSGCPKCSNNKKIKKMTKPFNQWLNEVKQIHKNPDGTPKYDYSETEKTYLNSNSKVKIICSKHGKFYQRANNHLFGRGCPICGNEQTSIKQKMSFEEFIYKAHQIHKNSDGTPKYEYNELDFNLANELITIYCPKHGYFNQTPHNHLEGRGCWKCSCCNSNKQNELFIFLKSNIKNDILTEENKLIKPKKLDIYIPDKKLAIEFDGLYWHSEYYRDKNYHLQKTEACEKQEIQLIHIFEDEWVNKQKIVKSRLLNILGKNKWKIGARNCIIKQVPIEQERIFLENNHLQGYIPSQICFGLYYYNKENNKEYLVSLMSFGGLRRNLGSFQEKDVYELYRFVNACNFTIIGAASKLFKHFIDKFKPKQIISFADRRWSINNKHNLYNQLGFKFDSYTKPGYFYVQGNNKINRFNLRKDILISKYGCSEKETEHEFCLSMGWPRIYDCGQLKYIWELN